MVSMFHTCAEYNQRAAAIESIRDGWSPAEFDCLGTRDQRWIRCCGQVQCVWGVWGGLCKPGEENTFPETRVKNCSNRGKRSGADAGAPGAIVEEMDYSGVSASEQCVRLRTTIEVAFTNMDGPLLKPMFVGTIWKCFQTFSNWSSFDNWKTKKKTILKPRFVVYFKRIFSYNISGSGRWGVLKIIFRKSKGG